MFQVKNVAQSSNWWTLISQIIDAKITVAVHCHTMAAEISHARTQAFEYAFKTMTGFL